MNKPMANLPPLPSLDRTIPHSSEAEIRLLAAILCRNELLPQFHFLKPSDFWGKAHQDIYAAMVKSQAAGQAITPFTLPAHLEDVAQFDPAGGVKRYLANLLAYAVDTVDPVHYARYIHELSRKRQIVAMCDEVLAAISRENDDRNSTQHAAALRDGIEAMESANELELFTDNHQVTLEILKGLRNPPRAVSTGLIRLDNAMDGGMFPGKSYGICARKKMGKTALAATISGNLNLAKIPHMFICGEMSPVEIQQRILNRYTCTFPSSFRSDYGKSDDFYLRITNTLAELPRCTFYHNAPGMTFSELKTAVTLAVERKKCRGFILDYWQLVGGKPKGKSTAEHQDEVAQWIADYSRQRNVWSLTMAQLNQDGNTRGSEGLRLAFDQVYELKRPNVGEGPASLEMLETRYTPWTNIDGLFLNNKGPFFEEN